MKKSIVRMDRIATVLVLGCLVLASVSIASAWFIQRALEVMPCPLCLEERLPYYAGIPLCGVLLYLLCGEYPPLLSKLLFCLLIGCFLFGAGLGIYHAGIEWAFWAGPTECTGQLAPLAGAGDLLAQLNTVKVIRCDQVTFRLFGQSLAVWNSVATLGIALSLVLALVSEIRRDQGSNSLSQ
jgi:disulfide bond formation protein DsbB